MFNKFYRIIFNIECNYLFQFGATDLGCYIDSPNTRDLNGYNKSIPSMTNELCINECRSRNFMYSGSQSG